MTRTEKYKYFDPQTRALGDITQDEEDVWFHSSDGVISRVVGEGELLIPYTYYAAFVAQMQTALQQQGGNILTASPQGGDSLVTVSGQQPDNDTTKRDMSSARGAKRKPPTAKQICKAHPEVVEILKDAKTIRELSGGTYRNFKELPTNTPQYIVDEINRRGCRRADGRPYTQETVSPIVAAMKITSRPTVFRACYLIVLAVIVSVFVTKVWFWFAVPSGISDTDPETVTGTTAQNKIKVDATLINQICEQNKIKLTEFRINLILKKTYTDKAALVAEVKTQYAAMLNAMQK